MGFNLKKDGALKKFNKRKALLRFMSLFQLDIEEADAEVGKFFHKLLNPYAPESWSGGEK